MLWEWVETNVTSYTQGLFSIINIKIETVCFGDLKYFFIQSFNQRPINSKLQFKKTK